MLINKIKEHFTQIPNDLIIDKDLSSGAKMVFCYIASKPTGWNVFNADIQKSLAIKTRQTLSNYWKELLVSGWITRYKNNDSTKAKIGVYIYSIHGAKNHCTEKPSNIKNRPQSNTKLINNTKSNKGEVKKSKYESFINDLKSKAILPSKVTSTQSGKEFFKSVKNVELLTSTYLLHQEEKKEFASRVTPFMEDYISKQDNIVDPNDMSTWERVEA